MLVHRPLNATVQGFLFADALKAFYLGCGIWSSQRTASLVLEKESYGTPASPQWLTLLGVFSWVWLLNVLFFLSSPAIFQIITLAQSFEGNLKTSPKRKGDWELEWWQHEFPVPLCLWDAICLSDVARATRSCSQLSLALPLVTPYPELFWIVSVPALGRLTLAQEKYEKKVAHKPAWCYRLLKHGAPSHPPPGSQPETARCYQPIPFLEPDSKVNPEQKQKVPPPGLSDALVFEYLIFEWGIWVGCIDFTLSNRQSFLKQCTKSL